jgi:hypothetical protein
MFTWEHKFLSFLLKYIGCYIAASGAGDKRDMEIAWTEGEETAKEIEKERMRVERNKKEINK